MPCCRPSSAPANSCPFRCSGLIPTTAVSSSTSCCSRTASGSRSPSRGAARRTRTTSATWSRRTARSCGTWWATTASKGSTRIASSRSCTVLAAGVLTPEVQDRLTALYQALDPMPLLRQIRVLQDALWRHAVFYRSGSVASDTTVSTKEPVRFDGRACGLDGTSATEPEPPVAAHAGQTTRGRRKPLGPRTYRTRIDPFAAVEQELLAWLTARPERTAKELLTDLQRQYPGQYADGLLRTLQRRVKSWRTNLILAFDTEWLANDPLAAAVVMSSAPAPVAQETLAAAAAGR